MLNRLKKMNAFGLTMLSLGAVFLLITFLSSISGVKSMADVWKYWGFWEAMERLGPNKRIAFISVILKIMNAFLPVIAGAFFAAAAVLRKESLKVPVVLSLTRESIILFLNIVTWFAEPGFSAYISSFLFNAIRLAAWVVLLTGLSRSRRLVFAVLRSLALAYSLVGVIRQIIEGFDLSIWYNAVNFAYYVLQTVTYVGLILWIVKPELFYRPENESNVEEMI